MLFISSVAFTLNRQVIENETPICTIFVLLRLRHLSTLTFQKIDFIKMRHQTAYAELQKANAALVKKRNEQMNDLKTLIYEVDY